MPDTQARNEGTIDLSYKPPKSMKKLTSVDDQAMEAGFEWDALDADPDIDVWAVRIPAGVSLLTCPSKRGGNSSYKLQSAEEEGALGGEEMESLNCLVPKRGDGGALYSVPRPLKRLILTREVPIPIPPLSTLSFQPARRPQPLDRLKHTFAPIGSEPVSPPSSMMEIDAPAEAESPKKKQKRTSIKTEVVEAKNSKGKGKSKDEKPQLAGEVMDIDGDAEPLPPKKSKKKSSRVNIKAEATGPAPEVKTEKKKRRAAGEE
ncbi:DNA-directed RNA polymerase I subunit RPA34.5 domain-containing protein [Rhizoctonia solani AG-1 IA]|uniref:DNA-directed RNA polymerase I subunit RPA34.5 domain-containing protein n=1 Tax=Thanatephorus cucumeris (strain AG1-IA) TaxID=983506 RepID=L8X0R8_THACA|nr:DNA-directed RNA polymerase I subunit RPA34.5 domain-containing protein [Rhizoctonia solani AG-1 IA]